MIEWKPAFNGHPGDQEADARCVEHGYWSLGTTNDGRWSVEVIEQDADTLAEVVTGGADLGTFDTEQEAKAAAQVHEDKFA